MSVPRADSPEVDHASCKNAISKGPHRNTLDCESIGSDSIYLASGHTRGHGPARRRSKDETHSSRFPHFLHERVFLLDGTPRGTAHFVGADLYHGQTCAFAGELFVLRAAIGYYECFSAY